MLQINLIRSVLDRQLKKLSELVRERREQRPDRAVEVWAFDEHRLGLRPVSRRQWAPEGQRPVAVGHPRYEWLYLYGFVHPGTGKVVWFVCSTVDTDLFSAVLAGRGRMAAAPSEPWSTPMSAHRSR